MIRFTKPIERIAFLAMLVGAVMLIAGAIGYWAERGGVDWYDFARDLDRIFEGRGYREDWHTWFARAGLALVLIGYVVAYHFDRLVAPTLRAAARLVHWVRTGG